MFASIIQKIQITVTFKMKINYLNKNQRPIKYKEYIQQLQNSSLSSIQDISIISQRSHYPDKSTYRQEYQKIQTKPKSQQQENQQQQTLRKSSYQFNNKSYGNQKSIGKLHTFCDAKLTERSIQFLENKKNLKVDQNILKQGGFKNQKYFKTQKKQNEQKENINFVNKILDNVEILQGKINKKSKQKDKNYENIEAITLRENQKKWQKFDLPDQQRNEFGNNQKISQIKKVSLNSSLHMKQSMSKNRKINISSIKNEIQKQSQKYVDQRVSKRYNQEKQEQVRQVYQEKEISHGFKSVQRSSKKKVVSLSINPLKVTASNCKKRSKNRILQKEKSRIEKTIIHKGSNQPKIDNIKQSKKQQLFGQNDFGIKSNSMRKIPSLQQSKIQAVGSKSNLLISQNSMTELILLGQSSDTRFLVEQVNILNKKITEQEENEKKLQKMISHLTQILEQSEFRQKLNASKINQQLTAPLQMIKNRDCQPFSNKQNKQIQMLQKDCQRLNNSYKDLQRLYQILTEEKEDLMEQMFSIKNQNRHLKQCLDHKNTFLLQLQQQIPSCRSTDINLQQQLTPLQYSSRAISFEIKRKIQRYEVTIASLIQQNKKLQTHKNKLENYNCTLNEELRQKDQIIEEKEYIILQKQQLLFQKQKVLQEKISQLIQYRRQLSQNQSRTGPSKGDYAYQNKIRELQNKLKLADNHISYLTQQIIEFKQYHHKSGIKNIKNEQGLCNNQQNVQNDYLDNIIGSTITTSNSSFFYKTERDCCWEEERQAV